MELLGEGHPATLYLVSYLAEVYHELKQLSEAERIYLHVSDMKTWTPGGHCSSTLHTRSILALVYRDQGRLEEIEDLILQVLKAQQKFLGVEDPSTCLSMGYLASIYLQQGHFTTSEALNRQLRNVWLTDSVPYSLAQSAPSFHNCNSCH